MAETTMDATVVDSAAPRAMDSGPPAPAVGSKVETWVPWVTGAALALPVLIARYPPMTDLPHYEAIVSLLRHWGDKSFVPEGLYTLNLGHPNQLFYFFAYLLSWIVPTDWACKIVVAGIVCAIPVAAGRLASHLGASRWAALLVAPMVLGWLFFWGLGTNLLGLALLLSLLPTLDRNAEDPTPRRALAAAGAMVALYFAHEAMMVLATVAVSIFAVVHPLGIKKTALRVLPAFVSTGLFAGQIVYQEKLKSASLAARVTEYAPLSRKIITVPGALFGGHGPVAMYTMFGLAFVAILAFGAVAHRARRAARARAAMAPSRLERVRGFLHRNRFSLVALAAFATYMAMPFTMNGATMVYHRFIAPAFALTAIAAAAGGARSTPRLLKIIAATLPVASLLIVWPEFMGSTRTYKELDKLLPQIEKNSSVAQVEIGTSDPERLYSAPAAAARSLAVNGGRMLYSMTNSTISPVLMRREYQWSDSEMRVMYFGPGFRPAHDLKSYRYVLVHSPGGMTTEIAIKAMAPEARLVDRTGEYILFESTLPVRPLVAPDDPLPAQQPRAATLRKRMRLVEEELRKENPGVAMPPADALPDTDPAHVGEHPSH